MLKRMASHLPEAWQRELRRMQIRRQISQGTFTAGEPEFNQLHLWLSPGNWAIDIGANIGHYTLRMADLVGASGRVIAFEPVPVTFRLLTESVAVSGHENVTLLNAAASSSSAELGMEIPLLPSGLQNLYMAAIQEGAGAFKVLGVPVDSLNLPGRVNVVKIDAEGHELAVLSGMDQLLRRDRPILVVEGAEPDVRSFLGDHGYQGRQLADSPNTIYAAESRTA